MPTSDSIASKGNCTLRRAEPRDARAIAEIYNEAIRNTTATFDTQPKSEEDRRAWLASHGARHPVLVAECEGQVVGWGALSAWSERPAYADTAESSFYVAEAWRGKGIGRALKQKLIEEAREAGLHTLLARVSEGNEASLHLNKSVGFVVVGTMREVGWKFGRRLDVHLMQLMLRGGPEPQRRSYSTGTPWENAVAYSRAVRVGQQVFVSGTTASDASGNTVAVGNAYEQTRCILEKIDAALSAVGAKRADVVRTRMFVTDIGRWEEIGRAHGEFFAGINPAATMVEVRRLINPDHLVEIEVDAVVAGE
jgi:phosphinothricin acetyltransferase